MEQKPGASPAQVAARAYRIWESEGRPEGAALDHWLRAEAELTAAPKRRVARKAGGTKAKAATSKKASGTKAKPASSKKPAGKPAGGRTRRPRGGPSSP